jgi:hypothetical protein
VVKLAARGPHPPRHHLQRDPLLFSEQCENTVSITSATLRTSATYDTDFRSKAKQSHYTPRRLQGERRCSSYSFLTSALDGGEWSASRPGQALLPGKVPLVPVGQESGWASELVWTQRLGKKSFASAGDRTPIVQIVARHYTE